MSCCAPALGIDLLDERAFRSLHAEWSSLLDRASDNRIFLTPEWHRLWWQHFGSGRALVLSHRSDEGRLRAILPLQITDTDGECCVTLAGDYNVADYLDAIAEKTDAVRLLADLWDAALCEIRWDRIQLRHVPNSSPIIPALERVIGERGLRMEIEQDEVCPVALLCSNWDGYLQMLTKKQRHEIRRKVRRAQEDVEWSWRTAATHDDIDEMLPTFFRLHELSGRDKAGFMTPSMRSYFFAMAHDWLDKGALWLSLFKRDGVDIAATMSFLHRDRFLLYNSGYDPEYAQFSPGIAAVAHAMQDAIGHRAVAFDFLSGDEPYKYQFGATNTYTCRVTVAR